MRYAADFRAISREALRGKWVIAVITGLVASLLGALGSEGPKIKLNIDATSGIDVGLEYAGKTILSTNGGFNEGLAAVIAGSVIYIALGAIMLAIVYFILGSV